MLCNLLYIKFIVVKSGPPESKNGLSRDSPFTFKNVLACITFTFYSVVEGISITKGLLSFLKKDFLSIAMDYLDLLHVEERVGVPRDN